MNHFPSIITHSEIVKINTMRMVEELISKMSDMDIPDTLYITIIMSNEPHLKEQDEQDEQEGWET